ncbi:MAG: VanZ family protein [Lachnospiraceae bacterium]|nr:VanZ family protein [Lachnospiraceae bacterium]
MAEITYPQMLIAITVLWILVRICIAVKNKKTDLKREVLLLSVYICIIVISRIVYFPWHHVDGHIDTLKFDKEKIIPFWLNLVPVVHLFDIYDGWQMNIAGNITMFIPVGIVWPICFKRLDNVWKTTLAGAGFAFFIELSQLLFYERSSDIDDILLNTTGVFIGALICFGIRRIGKKQ